MDILLVGVLVGLLIGIGVTYYCLLPKMKLTEELDQKIKFQNQTERNELKQLQAKRAELSEENDRLLEYLTQQSEKAKKVAQDYYNSEMKNVKKQLEEYRSQIEKSYKKAQDDYQQEYLKILSDAAENFEVKLRGSRFELKNLQDRLRQEKKTVDAAVEANKRAVEMENKKDFYRLVLSDQDKAEISELRKIIPNLRNAEPLNKVIYKVYYEKPYTDLIGRVVGSGIHCGIYKITNLENQMCYVGQAVNIAERWKQHIKRGLGAEAPTRNKLYPAMLAFGVENFSFEVIEECSRDKLDNREDYWQEYFKAKEFGYSIK
jgi:DNA repair exonuclease SbcCD ATPase subunit